MTPFAWFYMLSVWAFITALNVFCFSRVFKIGRKGPKE